MIRKSATSTVLAGLLVATGVVAAPRSAHIRYAEPVELPGVPALATQGTQRPTATARTHFDAFGHRFELQLEPNDRVLRKLPARDRQALPRHALYRGTISGLPGSWVRLTRLRDGFHGLVFDGGELYVLAPAGAIQGDLDVPLPDVARTTTLIFRAADTDSGLGPGFCRVLQPPATDPGAAGGPGAEPAYKAIFAELKASAGAIAAALPTKELDLALVGDAQLTSTYTDPAGEMLARLNNIDGIFSAQVGVRVVSGFVKTLTNNGGLTASVPETLLDQFESYRKATPDAASRGLAHLMTGRDLDGATVGIAYVGTLCAAQFAVSLSQTYNDSYFSSLIAAHELGHNFGAPHDGQSGAACAATPQNYLMAPAINGSSTFSQCSLDQIAPTVSAASCLTVPQIADVGIEFASAAPSGYADQDIHVPVDVVSNGTVDADQVVVSLRPDYASMQVASATVDGGTCALELSLMTCRIGSIAPGTRRRIDAVVRESTPSTQPLIVAAAATDDADASNNSSSVMVTILNPANGSMVASTTEASGYVGQTLGFSFTAANAGPLALQDARVEIQRDTRFTLLSAGGAGATCTTSFGMTTCALGALPAGESRRIDVSVGADSPVSGVVSAVVRSSNDKLNANDGANVRATLRSSVELTLAAIAGPAMIPVGSTVTRSFTLSSVGPQSVNDAVFDVHPQGGIEIESTTGAGATCVRQDGTPVTYHCTYAAPIESGGTRQVDVQVRGVSAGPARLDGTSHAPDSRHLPGFSLDRASVDLSVRSVVDVRMELNGGLPGYDHIARTVYFQMTSNGASPAPNTRFTLSLAPGVRANAAQSSLGTCALAAEAVTCSIGTLAAGAMNQVQVELVSDIVGRYSMPVSVTADGDTVTGNDAITFVFDVHPNTDAILLPLPVAQHLRPGEVLDYSISVKSATQPITGANVHIDISGDLTVLQVTPSQGTCDAPGRSFGCRFGAMPANSTVTAIVRLRADAVGRTNLFVYATADADVDFSNGSANGIVIVDARGNVSLAAEAPTAAATVGTALTLPRLTVNALSRTDDVQVSLTVPAAFSITSATADGGPCSVDAGSIRCSFGTLEAGVSRAIMVRLRPNQSGSFTTRARATAADDSDTSNNSADVSITVGKAASSGSSGGGGGGALDTPALLLLTLLAPAVVRRRKRT